MCSFLRRRWTCPQNDFAALYVESQTYFELLCQKKKNQLEQEVKIVIDPDMMYCIGLKMML